VFITGRRQSQLDAITAVRCDVGDLTDLDAVYTVVKEQAGRIDGPAGPPRLRPGLTRPRAVQGTYSMPSGDDEGPRVQLITGIGHAIALTAKWAWHHPH